MADKARSRFRAASCFLTVILAVGALFGACTEGKRGIGDECIRNDDCVSDTCVARRCTAPPPFTDAAQPQGDGAVGTDSSGEAGDSGDSGGGDGSSDGSGDADGPGEDVTNDAPADSGSDVTDA